NPQAAEGRKCTNNSHEKVSSFKKSRGAISIENSEFLRKLRAAYGRDAGISGLVRELTRLRRPATDDRHNLRLIHCFAAVDPVAALSTTNRNILTTTLAADARNDCLVEMKAALAKRRVSGQIASSVGRNA